MNPSVKKILSLFLFITLGLFVIALMGNALQTQESRLRKIVSTEEFKNSGLHVQLQALQEKTTESDNKLKELNEALSLYKEVEDVEDVSGNFISTNEAGVDSFLQANGAEFVKEAGDTFRAVGEHYKIKPEMMVCIAQADSSLGQALKGKNNIGNVGSYDRGGTTHYATLEAGIEAMGKTLNNGYLGSYTTIGELSNGGRTALGLKACGVDGTKCYATSASNWNRNTIGCLREITKDDSVNENYTFRLE